MRDFINFLRSKNSALAETLAVPTPPGGGTPPLPADYAANTPPMKLPGVPKRPLGANRKFLKKFQQGAQNVAANYQTPDVDSMNFARTPSPEEEAEYQASQQLLAPDEEVPTQTVNPYTPWRTGQVPAVPSKTTAPPARGRVG
jgi:hypothetical protein